MSTTLKSLTKVELVALIQERDATIEALRLEVAKLTPIKRVPAAAKFWDEFPDRKAAMDWAKSHGGVVRQRPVQRAES